MAIDQAKENMEKAIKALEHEFVNLRTGRPSAALLDEIKVDYYGAPTPVSQLAAVKVPEAHLMVIEPWDKSVVGGIEKAILASNLGITPNNDGSGTIRLPFPAPTEERRKEIVKECRAAAERARIAVRNARRDANSKIEKMKKDSEIGEDEERRMEDEVQKLTDSFIAKIDAHLATKEDEVMEI